MSGELEASGASEGGVRNLVLVPPFKSELHRRGAESAEGCAETQPTLHFLFAISALRPPLFSALSLRRLAPPPCCLVLSLLFSPSAATLPCFAFALSSRSRPVEFRFSSRGFLSDLCVFARNFSGLVAALRRLRVLCASAVNPTVPSARLTSVSRIDQHIGRQSGWCR